MVCSVGTVHKYEYIRYQKYVCMQSCTKLTLVHTTHAQARAHTRTHMHPHTHMHTHAHTNTYTHYTTHIHTKAFCLYSKSALEHCVLLSYNSASMPSRGSPNNRQEMSHRWRCMRAPEPFNYYETRQLSICFSRYIPLILKLGGLLPQQQSLKPGHQVPIWVAKQNFLLKETTIPKWFSWHKHTVHYISTTRTLHTTHYISTTHKHTRAHTHT